MGEAANPFGAALIAELPGLRRYAAVLTGSLNAADDLVQDCIERALNRAGTLQDQERLGAWLRSILHNLHTDELRRKRRRGTGVEISEMDNDLALSTAPATSGGSKDFMKALDSLSAEHRQILLLAGLEGMDYREIATELGVPIGTVMSRLARARERLRSALEQEHVAPTVQPISGRRVVR